MSEEIQAKEPSIEEFFERLTPKLHDTKDTEGLQIEGLEGLMFKPLDSKATIEIEGLREKNGEETSWQWMFIRGLVKQDGTQFLSDAHAPRLDGLFGRIMGRAMKKIRMISGQPDDDVEESQKKTSLTTPQNSNSSSD